MRKNLRRVLERLRAATNGVFGKRVSARGGVHEPQRMDAMLVAVGSATGR